MTAEGLRGRNWEVSQWGIDRDHGVFVHRLYEDCQAAGLEPLPDAPVFGANIGLRFGRQVRRLLAKNRSEYTRLAVPVQLQDRVPVVVADDRITIQLGMPGHAVRLLIIAPRDGDQVLDADAGDGRM